jgi:hypothetical protein
MRLSKHPFTLIEEFEHLGNRYKIEIICKSNGSGVNKKLIVNDVDEYINSDATRKLSEIINPAITKYSSISEQGQSTLLLFQKPAERLKQFKEILGIDNINFIVQKLKDDIKENKSNIDILNAEINVLKGKSFILQDIPDLLGDEESLKVRIESLKVEKKLFESENNLYQKYLLDLDTYNKANSRVISYESDLESIVSKLQVNDTRLKKIPDYDSLLYENLLNKYSLLEKEKLRYDYEMGYYNKTIGEIKILQENISKVKELQKNNKPSRVKTCVYTVNILKEFQLELNSKKVELGNIISKIELAVKGKCPTCGQDFKVDKDGLLKNKENLLSDIELLETRILNISSELETYNKILLLEETKKVKYNSDGDIIKQYEEQLNNLLVIKPPELRSFDIDAIKIQIDEYKIIKNNYESIIKINSAIQTEIEILNNKRDLLFSQIQDLKLINKPLEMFKPIEFNDAEFEIIKKTLITLQNQKQEIKRIEEYNTKIVADRKLNNNIIINKENEVDKLHATNRILNSSKDLIDKDFSSWLVDRGCNFIKQKMNDFFTKSYGRYEVTFKQDKNSIDFFYNEIGGIPRPVVMASGFEKQILSIANRVALSSLQNLGFLIGDEMDSEAGAQDSIRMFEVLFNEKSFNQFFITTHKDDVKEFIEQRDDSQKFSLEGGNLVC